MTELRTAEGWHEANQAHLVASLAEVRAALSRHAALAAGPSGEQEVRVDPDAAPPPAPWPFEAPPALDTVCAAFGLSPFERSVLLLCAGPELDSTFPSLCAAAQGDARRTVPTFGLALAALPDPHWSALTPASSLRRWRLIELRGGDSLATAALRIDERILHFLAGAPHLDDRLAGLVRHVHIPPDLPPSHRDVAERMVALWRRAHGRAPLPVVQLCGSDPAGKLAVAAWACAQVGASVYAADLADLPGAPAEREAAARLWDRETILGSAALIVECQESEGPESARSVMSFLGGLMGIGIVSVREPLRGVSRSSVRFDVGRPLAEEQAALWEASLGPGAASTLDGSVAAVVAQFDLGPNQIESVSAEVLGGLESVQESDGPGLDGSRGAPDAGTLLWDACRAQSRPRLEDLAQRIDPDATWEDLVLPAMQMDTLREVAAHVRHRRLVYDTWGFARKSRRGLGISALFAGPSGTGKTMAAEVLANELRLDLYRIDLSQVVSKYIGETEKNLRRVFDAAEEGGSILLFDEADALFGKRSEVKDSHDRYANIEVSYLLQRMESYRGLAILTTNLKSALDTAFLRRLRFVMQFPFPEAAQRAEIWRRIFPEGAPLDGLDVHRLARLNVAGGNIRNIALSAAFLAVDAGEPVRMSHLLRAARSEYTKLEKPLTDAEVGGWIR
ncbi:MAG: ATP-binding protein [Actinomycetota bacterium]|nr:ATP-binding protein [Actinomycetota bacterium]